ncbi:hypothetical protein BGZ81_006692 [Podila clonocystis]|nr:hypothetical protein BGZ81_006692 [Podila clonocystis]
MKFSTHLLAICAAAIVATAPGLTSAQATWQASSHHHHSSKPVTTVPTVPPTTTAPPVTTLPPVATTTATVPPVITTPPRTFTNSVITVAPTPVLPATCNSSGDCPANYICRLLNNTSVSGTCQALNTDQLVCPASPTLPCNTHADCKTPEFSYCAMDSTTKQNVCTGFGRPGTATECKNGTTGTGGSSSGNVGKTLMYAGIAVGGIALLGIVFALVRWQRRRQRSKMPKSMFGDMDYGVSNRRSAGLGASSAAAGGGGGGGGDQYPFSSRPHAQEDNYNYDDNYYESPGGYNNNMHPMTGMAGGAKANDPYYSQGQGQDQYYDDQYYAKEGYNNGYDQNGQYASNGQEGFYDTQNMQAGAGYDNYQYPEQQYDQYGNQYDQYGQYTDQQGLQQGAPAGGQQGYNLTDDPTSSGAGVAVPPEAVVRATSPRHQATGDYAVDHYAVEPSELDFGGDTKGAQGGYGRKY